MMGPAMDRRNCSKSATLLLSEPMDEYVGPETLSALSRPLLTCWTSRAPGEAEDDRPPGLCTSGLLKLYIHRIRSGRYLEAETHRNIEVIWLLRRLKPTSRAGRWAAFSMGRDPLSSLAGPLFGLTDDQLTIRIVARPSLAVLRDTSGIDLGAQLRPASGQSARRPDGPDGGIDA